MHFAQSPNSTILSLVSAILLSLSSDGDWQEDFIRQIGHFIPSLTLILDSAVSEAMENISIILQKLSKDQDWRKSLKEHTRLFKLMQDLSQMQVQSFGGGGDISFTSDVALRPDGGQKGISEFLFLNLQSTLKNLS